MKHYQSLDEVLEELREPNSLMIEGIVEINGIRYHVDAMTIHLSDKRPKPRWSIWVEEDGREDKGQLKLTYPDYFPTENF